MKQIFIGIGIILGLLVTVWGGFEYLEKYALKISTASSAEVQKVDQKMDKAIEMLDKKTEKMINYFDYKFLVAELKAIEERIYEKEKEIAKNPNDLVKKAELESLKRQREQIIRDMKNIKK
jgi:hypothetical protein